MPEQPASADRGDIMRRLRAETADLHAATEALPLMLRLMSCQDEPAQVGEVYASYLRAVHAAYAAVEPLLFARVPPELLTRLGVQPKLPALQCDLAALATDAALSSGHWPRQLRARITGEPEALGGLYVLEGATLGGQLIARRLRRHIEGLPTAFLEFGCDAPGQWRRFGQAVSDWTAVHGQQDAVIAGAIAVFDCVHDALREAGRRAP